MIQTEMAEQMTKYQAHAQDVSYKLENKTTEYEVLKEDFEDQMSLLNELTTRFEAEELAHQRQGEISLAHESTIGALQAENEQLSMSTHER